MKRAERMLRGKRSLDRLLHSGVEQVLHPCEPKRALLREVDNQRFDLLRKFGRGNDVVDEPPLRHGVYGKGRGGHHHLLGAIHADLAWQPYGAASAW